MGGYVAKQTVKQILSKDKNIKGARVLVMGMTFKEDVTDIRNSKVIDVIRELQDYTISVDVVDAFADAAEVKEEYGVELVKEPNGKYDAVVVAVNHKQYSNLSEEYFENLTGKDGVVIDVKGIYRDKINKLAYWSL